MTTANQAWALLPAVVFAAFVAMGRAHGLAGRESVLRAALAFATLVWVVSNVLSAFSVLRPAPARIAWTVLAAVAVLVVMRRCRSAAATEPEARASGERWAWPLAIGTATLVLLALAAAVLSPPVTVDVLNYHGPRQLLWAQQGSLAHFVTTNDRALMMPPLAEVIGLQFLLLTGGDRWANAPQWFAYVLLAVAVYSPVRTLRGSRFAAWLGVWLVASLPMAYLEASNGKNDLQAALWLTLLACEVARLRTGVGAVSWWAALRGGGALALAVLTKSTALLFAPPLVAVAGWTLLRRDRARAPAIAGIAALAFVLLTTPFFARNFAWYGSPLGEHRAEEGGEQQNTAFSPAIAGSNLLRNATLHLALPGGGLNATLEKGVLVAHRWLSLSPEDSRTTLWGSAYRVTYQPGEETRAGAPWHFVLIGIALVACICTPRLRETRWLAVTVLAMIVLFALALKWQPWAARLQLPVFVLGSVLVAIFVDLAFPRHRAVAGLVVGLGALVAWWPSRQSTQRPLWSNPAVWQVDRDVNRYRYFPALRDRDTRTVALLSAAQAREVALVSVHDMPYSLMLRLQAAMPQVRFFGAPAAEAKAVPDALVSMEFYNSLPLYHVFPSGERFRLVGDSAGDCVYLPIRRIEALGWRDRLPAFCGWTLAERFDVYIDCPTLTSRPVVWRELSDPPARLRFRAWSAESELRAVISNPNAAERLVFSLNDQPLGSIAVPAGAKDFEVALPMETTEGSANGLLITRVTPGREPLVFSRLTVADRQAAATSAGSGSRAQP